MNKIILILVIINFVFCSAGIGLGLYAIFGIKKIEQNKENK